MITKLRANISSVALIAAYGILAAYLGKLIFLFARHAVMAISFPYSLEYGEGPILDQILRLASAENIYRNTITMPPYTITSAPPLFMLLQVPFFRVFGPAFWYGRGISVISLVIAATFLSLALYQLTGDRLASLISGLLIFTIPYFWNWSVLDRVDTLALGLSWAGLWAIIRWPDQRRGLVASIILFTAALSTQQTNALVAPITALVWLLQSRRTRRAVELFAGVGGSSVAIFLAINGLTQGGFFLNLVTYNPNLWNYPQVAGKFFEILLNSFIFGLFALIFFLGERLDTPTRTWPLALPYLVIATLVTLLVGKAGSNDGYMYEMSAAFCLATGAALAWLKNHWIKAAALLLIAMQVNSFFTWTTEQYLPEFEEKIANRPEIAQLASLVRQANGPILADEYNGLLPLTGKQLYYQPFEFAQLARAGLWDPAPLMSELAQRKFTALLIYFPRNFNITRSRWPENLYSAIWDTYTNTGEKASNLVCLPIK